jgi:hypothetical protein
MLLLLLVVPAAAGPGPQASKAVVYHEYAEHNQVQRGAVIQPLPLQQLQQVGVVKEASESLKGRLGN